MAANQLYHKENRACAITTLQAGVCNRVRHPFNDFLVISLPKLNMFIDICH